MAITNGFEMVFNRRLIFGENKVTEIPGILNWYNKKKVLFVTFSAEFDAFKKISFNRRRYGCCSLRSKD